MARMPSDRARPDDRPATLAAVFAFSLGLGIGTIAVPLVALAAGYDPPAVGFLAAVAATTQLGTRLVLPWALGRWRDRSLMIAGCLALAGMFGLLLTSTALPVFIAAQVLQGTARSMFWTSSQTHAVRGPGSSVRRLVDLNVAGNLGTLSGPAIAGMLALVGLPLALGAAVIAATDRGGVLAAAAAAGGVRPLALGGHARPHRPTRRRRRVLGRDHRWGVVGDARVVRAGPARRGRLRSGRRRLARHGLRGRRDGRPAPPASGQRASAHPPSGRAGRHRRRRGVGGPRPRVDRPRGGRDRPVPRLPRRRWRGQRHGHDAGAGPRLARCRSRTSRATRWPSRAPSGRPRCWPRRPASERW